MKTIHRLACIVLLAGACTDPPPASVTTQPVVAAQNAPIAVPTNNLNAERTPDADVPVTIPTNALLPTTVPQPNPPCTSCPIGPDLQPQH